MRLSLPCLAVLLCAPVLVAAGPGKELGFWEASTGKPLRRFAAHGGSEIYSVCFSPDGSRVASAGSEGSIRLWSVQGKQWRVLQYDGPEETQAVSLAFAANGRR